MSNLTYNYVNDGTSRTLTVSIPSEGIFEVIEGSNPNFRAALGAAREGNVEGVIAALDILGTLNKAIEGTGLAVEGSNVTYRGEALPDSLSKALIAVLREKGDAQPLINFIKRLDNNPSMNSRNQLHKFVDLYGLTIDEDGYLIAYKGVTASPTGDYRSINHGYGIVDGVEHDGALPNYVGARVQVPRRKVSDDTNSACSFGLHAGTYEYASTFGHGATLTVRIDPKDVVSVPHDCSAQKIRCSEYVVIATTEQKWTRSTVWDGTADYDTDEYDDENPDEYEVTFYFPVHTTTVCVTGYNEADAIDNACERAQIDPEDAIDISAELI